MKEKILWPLDLGALGPKYMPFGHMHGPLGAKVPCRGFVPNRGPFGDLCSFRKGCNISLSSSLN